MLAVVGLSLLAACAPPPAKPPPGGDSVLVLSPPDVPVVRQAIAEIQRRNERLRGVEPPLRVEIRPVDSGAQATALLQTLLPQIGRYRVIFTPSQTTARAAQLLVPDRPIVFDGIDDPVGLCLVDSLRRPGRNATGYMHQLPDTERKMLELLHDGFPALREVVVLVSGLNVGPSSCAGDDPVWQGVTPPCEAGPHPLDAALNRMIEADRIASYARRLGMAARFLVLCNAADFARLRAAPELADAGFLVPWHALFDEEPEPLVAALDATRRPAVYPSDRFIDAGGMLSLEPILDLGKDRATVLMLMQVIGGRAPATLPVQAPRGFEITLNTRSAERLGLRPSLALLRRVDRFVPAP